MIYHQLRYCECVTIYKLAEAAEGSSSSRLRRSHSG